MTKHIKSAPDPVEGQPIPEHDHSKGITTTYQEMLNLKQNLEEARLIMHHIAFETEKKGAMNRTLTGKEAMHLFMQWTNMVEKYFDNYHPGIIEAYPVMLAGLWMTIAQVDAFFETNPQFTGNTGQEVA